jgi:hypothetical protein
MFAIFGGRNKEEMREIIFYFSLESRCPAEQMR